MRKSMWVLGVLAVGAAGWAGADEPPRKFDVDRLLDAEPEKMLGAAMLYSPEIRLAEEKLRGAEAEWKRTKAAVALKIQNLREEREKARDTIGNAEEKLQNAQLPAAEKKILEEARTRAREVEREKNRELAAALGVAPLMPADAPPSPYFVDRRFQSKPVANPREQLPKELVARLDKDLAVPLTFEENFEMPLPLALVELQKKAGSKFVVQTKFQSDQGDGAQKIEVKIPKSEGLTLGAVLLMIEDWSEIEIDVREYGLLIVPRENTITGSPIPLRDYLKK